MTNIEEFPLISVITPSFNSETFINETIESVLAQTYMNWEMIIVDDCSTDRTVERINPYLKQDERIQLIQLDQNAGSAVARNTAIDQAKGRYLAFLDSDDLWLPEKLDRQLHFMKQTDAAFSFTEYKRITEDGTELPTNIAAPRCIGYKGLMKHCVIGCLTVMLDVEQTGKVHMKNLRARQDYVLWLTLTKQGFLAYGLPEVLAKYRIVRNSVSSNKFKMVRRNWNVYRNIENQSVAKSFWYIINYAFHYVKRVFYPIIKRLSNRSPK